MPLDPTEELDEDTPFADRQAQEEQPPLASTPPRRGGLSSLLRLSHRPSASVSEAGPVFEPPPEPADLSSLLFGSSLAVLTAATPQLGGLWSGRCMLLHSIRTLLS